MKIVCTSACCHCPKCWDLDPTAVCISDGGQGRPVHTVRSANDEGIETIHGPGFRTHSEAQAFIDAGGPWM